MRPNWKTVSTLTLVVSLLAPQLGAQNATRYLACVDSTSAAERVRIKQLTKNGKDVKLMTTEELGKICKRPSQVALVKTAQAETPKPAPAPAPAPTKVEATAEPDPTPAQLVADNSASKPRVSNRLPFTSYEISQEGLARAILAGTDGDPTTLNIKASEFVRAMNEAFPDLRLENRRDLANLIQRLEAAPLPKGKIRLSRIYPTNRKVELKGWVRETEKNEQGLYDPQTGQWMVSLHCGNIIPSLKVKGWVPPKEVVQAPAPDSSAYLEEQARIRRERDEAEARRLAHAEREFERRAKFVSDSVDDARRARERFVADSKTTTSSSGWRPGKWTYGTVGGVLAATAVVLFIKAASGPGGCSAVSSPGACH